MSGRVLAYIDPGTVGLVVGGGGGLLLWLLTSVAFLKWQAKRIGGFFKKHPKGGGALVLLLVLASAGGAYRYLKDDAPVAVDRLAFSGDAFERVFLLGLDGTDPDVIRELMEAGLMPNLTRVATAGSFGELAVTNPAESPVVWASLATGQNPGKHGVFDFIGREADTYLPYLSLTPKDGASPLKAKAFWDVATEHGVPTTLIRWPMTYPPPKVLGRVLGGLGVPDVRGGLGRYSTFTDQAPKPGSRGAEKVTVVEVKDSTVTTQLAGPRAANLIGSSVLTTPLSVRLAKNGKSAVITVGEKSYAVDQGGWTGFAEVSFQGKLFKRHKGLVRFHLKNGQAPFELYATSVELHPDWPLVPFTSPPAYGSELKEKIGFFHTLGMPEDTKALGEGRLSEEAFLAMCTEVERERRAMLLYELQRFDTGLLAFVFDTPDRIQHMTPTPTDLATSPIGRYYIEFDRFLGTVLDKVPENTPMLIFSDHGFSTFDRAVDLNRWLEREGYLVVDEAAFAQRKAGSNGELYQYVDWSKTKAYAAGFAGIYVNIEGREGQGIVPKAQAAGVAKEIAEKLKGLRDPEGNKQVVHRVFLRDEVYSGPHAGEAPGVVVGLMEGYRGSWQTAVGGLAGQVVSQNHQTWQRDHIVDATFVPGTLITNFPLKAKAPHVYDLAPTVLTLLGLPVPVEMEGTPLQSGGHLARR